MPYETFDRSRLRLKSLSEREHRYDLSLFQDLDDAPEEVEDPELATLAERIVAARERGSQVIFAIGAHVIRRGVARFLSDLMERGVITHIAGNGAVAIHDFEFALIGATCESVAQYISTGQFGLWEETGRLNDIARVAAEEGIGYGEAIGREVATGDYPHADISLLAGAYRLGVPATVHVSIGQDIHHEHPNCDGAALGAASYTDFLILARSVEGLEGGAYLTFGTQVMGPEVYLKALAMARNVAVQEARHIADFTTAVFDLKELPDNYHEQPAQGDPNYYFRPWKTILVRTVADGGESFYFNLDHAVSIPSLWRLIVDRLEDD
ncbi:MAG: hypothetical protein U9R79_00280 [Armatimonadota bacterium]|nr:hypothetical protein [Armatimonadota bacterium]